MSERLHPHHESGVEQIDTSEQEKKIAENLKHGLEHEKKQDAEKLANEAKRHAVSGRETFVGEHHKESSSQSFVSTKQLKKSAYTATLGRVRKHLPKAERTFSKVIHQPTVEKVSNVGASTIARPAGLLGGGLAAFGGSVFVLYFAKRYGFEYNYGLFIVLFVIGFFSGLLAEMLGKLAMRRNRS